MGNKTIEEAVALMETATRNIKEELKHDAQRDGVTLEELIQLLSSGTSINLAIQMNGRYWETRITVLTKTLNGLPFKSTDSLRDPSVVLSRKVKQVRADSNGLLWVYLEEDK